MYCRIKEIGILSIIERASAKIIIDEHRTCEPYVGRSKVLLYVLNANLEWTNITRIDATSEGLYNPNGVGVTAHAASIDVWYMDPNNWVPAQRQIYLGSGTLMGSAHLKRKANTPMAVTVGLDLDMGSGTGNE